MSNNGIVQLSGFILLLLSLLFFYFQSSQEQSFSNALVSNQIIELKSPAAGRIYDLKVNRGDWVKKGTVLLNIGDVAHQMNIERQIELTKNAIQNAIKGCLGLIVLEKQLQQSHLGLAKIENEILRKQKLVGSALISAEVLSNLEFELAKLKLQVEIQSSLLRKEQYEYRQPFTQRTDLQLAIADLKQAFYHKYLNMISAPADGYVYDINIYQGEYVSEEQLLLLFIPKDGAIIEANILESQISLLSEGDPVDIIADAYPERIMTGYVHSIVPSTASSFSVLPRNNIDSNWTKISQRIPVIFKLDPIDNKLSALPIGASVTVKMRSVGSATIQAPDVEPSQKVDVPQHNWQTKFDLAVAQIFKQNIDETIVSQCQQ